MSTPGSAITDQAGVNSATDFDAAAAGTLGIEAGTFPETEAQPAQGDAGKAADAAAAPGAAKEGIDTQAAAGEQTDGQKAAPTDEWVVDQAVLDKLLADPAHGAFVKTLHEKYTKAVEAAKVWGPEAQEARALVPGGLNELKETVELARSARAEAADFASGDPARQRGALASVAEENPEQFVAGIPIYLEIAAQKNPQAYQTFMQGELKRALETEGAPGILQALFAAAAGDPDDPKQAETFAQAFAATREWADKMGFAAAPKPGDKKEKPVDPEVAALKARLAKYEKDDRTANEQAWNTWSGETNQAMSTQVRETAEAMLDHFLPKNVEKNFRDFTMKQLLDKVETEVIRQLSADLGHQEKVSAVLNGAAWKKDGAAARTQVVNLQAGRAKLLLPAIVQKLMDPVTKAAVDAAQQKNEKEKTAAARADVTGAGATASPRPWTVKDVKRGGALAGKTEEEILEM